MKLCKIVGKCWSTVKDEQLTGSTFLLAREIQPDGQLDNKFIVSVDELGSAEGDIVLISEGIPISGLTNKPVDSAIVAIIERYSINDKIL